MRWLALASLTLLAGPPAWAQNNEPTVVVPSAPAIVSAPLAPAAAQPSYASPPPGLVQTPSPGTPANSDSANTNPGAPVGAQTVPPDVAPTFANIWLPGSSATLGVLDKVGGGVSKLVIPVGGQAKVGDLQVSVQSCVSRPPGQIPDTAVFLSIQGKAASSPPVFHGWMVRSAPGAAVVGDASESFRVISCK